MGDVDFYLLNSMDDGFENLLNIMTCSIINPAFPFFKYQLFTPKNYLASNQVPKSISISDSQLSELLYT